MFLYYGENQAMVTFAGGMFTEDNKIQTKINDHTQGILTNNTSGMAKHYHHRNVHFCAISLAVLGARVPENHHRGHFQCP